MSDRLPAGLPFACSGLMYAAVPRMTPICVIAGVVIVGELVTPGLNADAGSSAFARPKSRTFTVPSGRSLMFAGFRSRWMTPCSCAASSASEICPRDRQGFADRNRALRDAIRERGTLDEFEDKRMRRATVLEAVNRGDVRMIQRRQHLGFAPESREPIRIQRERFGQHLQRHVAIQLRVARAIHLPHPARTEDSKDFIGAEARAGSEYHAEEAG